MLALVVFGPLGVVAGSVAVWKGVRWWWGMLGVSGSAVAGFVGYSWAGGVSFVDRTARPCP